MAPDRPADAQWATFTERQKISSAFALGPGLTASDDAKAGCVAKAHGRSRQLRSGGTTSASSWANWVEAFRLGLSRADRNKVRARMELGPHQRC